MKNTFIIIFLASSLLFAKNESNAPGTLKWRCQVEAIASCSPAIGTDGIVYIGTEYTEDNYLYAINTDGRIKWRYKTGDWIQNSPAIGTDGTIYVGSADKYLYAIKPEGTLKWKYRTESFIITSPAIGSDGTIYVGSDDKYLYAISSTGKLKWRFKTGDMVRSQPTIGSDGTIYIGSDDEYFYAISPSGKLKWKYSVDVNEGEDGVQCSPAIDSNSYIYATGSHYLYAFSPFGQLMWLFDPHSNPTTSPVIGSDGTIYFGDLADYLYAIRSSGKLKWKYKTEGPVFSTPAIGTDGTIYVGSIYVGSNDGYLYAINSSGKLKWRYRIGQDVNDPAIGLDGTVYVGSDDGYLYAIRTDSRGLANSPWPKFGHDNQNTGRASAGEVIASIPTTPTTTTLTEPPKLTYSVITTDPNSNNKFEGGEQVSLSVTITNTGKGKASGVTAELSGDADLISRFGSKLYFGDIEPGKSATRQTSAALPYDIEARTAQIDVRVSESSLGRLPDVQRIQVACVPAQEKVTVTEVSRLVEVDVVPAARQPDPNVYAVVIGISKYREENIPDITYAENDAKIVAQYFTNVLGVPSQNLYTFYDDRATVGDFADLLNRILPNATQGGKTLYFYYAGHGTPIPDKSGMGRAYLVPYDGQLGSQYKLYSLDSLYAALGELSVNNVLVFVDACFSGTGRSALASGQRPAVLAEIPTETWPTNLRVIAAAQGTQTAWDYEDVKHGLFTYYLLDGLRGSGDTDADGYIEFGELYDYIHSSVLTTSTKTLLKRQEPSFLPEGENDEFRILKVK